MDISNKELLKDKCYINGNWVISNSKELIEVNNPATLDIIGRVPKCGIQETKLSSKNSIYGNAPRYFLN